MSITIRDVARKTNFAVGTISRVINNSPNVNPEIREKVLKVIRKTEYHRNTLALRLSKKKSFTIGVFAEGLGLFDRINFYFLGEILGGIGIVANEDDKYEVSLQVSKSNRNQYDYVRFFDEQRVDGVIIVFPGADNPGVKELEKRGLPAVVVNNSEYNLDYVEADNTNGTIRVVEHLIELGHKRIGMINLSKELNITFQERFEIYQSTLLKHNIPYIEELVIHGGYDETAGYGAMKKLLVRKPTAIFAANDRLAIGAMRAIQEAGLRIPQDIAVVGYDDTPSASIVIPSLTTVRQPFFELGQEAIKVAIERIEGRVQKRQNKILPAKLIIRSSTKK